MKAMVRGGVLAGVLVACACTAPGKTAPFGNAMTAAKPGAVKPAGWLRDRACAARDGLTGHMDEVDEHFRLAWTTNCMRRGSQVAWPDAHRGSWSAEGGAYWFDGLVKLAFQLDDPDLKALAKRRLDPLLDHVGPNSIGYLWWYDRRKRADVDDVFAHGVWRMWTAGTAERALAAWWEATGDARVPRAFTCAYSFDEIARRKGGFVPSLLSAAVDASRIARSPEVARFADLCCEAIAQNQYARPPWDGEEETLNLRRKQLVSMLGVGDPCGIGWPRHGVMASEYLLSLVRAYQWTGNARLLESVLAWYAFFDRYCSQPYGVTMMDEEWGWAGAARGTETCDVAAEMFTRETLLAALGDGKWGDDVEVAFFNAGAACVSRDFKRHVYFQMPNRVGAVKEGASMSCPSESHVNYQRSVWPLCCTAALNRILPNFVQAMWMKTAEGGVAAALYGPSAFAAEIPAGRVAFTETTDYPFADTIAISVDEAPAKPFALKVRLPGWCTAPEVRVNGTRVEAKAVRGFAALERVWRKGDRVELRLPMTPVARTMRDMNEFGRTRAFVSMGPLLFAQGFAEKDENTPAGPVVVPVVDPKTVAAKAQVARGPVPRPWDWRLDAPVKLLTRDAKGAPLTLVPYGCAKLHVSMFPVD